ncbi:FkbM family methyltransferase [Thermoleophilia bacterium SCSIO 60948]|nr:FkbM family methyltransferase [Thermoleophilia bacterium SCSIO 60948]
MGFGGVKPRRARNELGRGLLQIGGPGVGLPEALLALRGNPNRADDKREEAALRSLDLEGRTVYDVGAFRGITAMVFARMAGPGGHVFCFEPHPENFRVIERHLELNGVENVTPLNEGVGRERSVLALSGAGGTASFDDAIAASYDTDPEERIEVSVRSIDEHVADAMAPPDFVKIDVEGLEGEVLAGMHTTLRTIRPRVFVEMHGADEAAKRANAREVVGLLLDAGYAIEHVESGRALSRESAEDGRSGHLLCAPA